MTPFHVVIYTSLTLIAFILVVLLYYFIKTRKMLKNTEKRNHDMQKELKPGMQVVCGGGLIATYEGCNDDHTIATVRLSNKQIIDVAYYSISNILL